YRAADVPVPDSIKARMASPRAADTLEQLQILTEARKQLGARKELEGHRDLDATIRGMTRILDARTVYLDPETAARRERFSVNKTSQVGVYIRRDKETGDWSVLAPWKDSPAYKAGIRSGDVLVSLRRSDNGDESIAARTLPAKQIEDLLEGAPGTRIDL